MAETASLTSARTHARNAAEEFEKLHYAPAVEQHQQAAADFARAARGSSDHEALRVLKLLEDQHHKLARIVKSRDVSQADLVADTTALKDSKPVSSATNSAPNPPEKRPSSKSKSNASAMASTRLGSAARDSSPSLARDMATRRGIPTLGRAPPTPAAQARARQLSPESQSKAMSPKIPPSIVDSRVELARTKKSKKVEDDEGFAKFYSNLTTGTMSKLSSVLAYAGLPLTAEDAVNMDPSEKERMEKRSTVRANNEPDVQKIFSKAALEAIEDDHRQRGTFGHGFGAAESFYVVPAGGGSLAYAEVARARHQDATGDDEEAEFVDAKEMPGPPSPKHNRVSEKKRSSFGMPRTQEELELENTTLKTTLERLAGRLSSFEAHAQDASMAALEQSMASMKAGPAAENAKGDDPQVQQKLRVLEAKLQEATQKEQNAKVLAERQAKELKKYRYHFDELKKGAHKKEKVKQEKRETFGTGDGVAGE